MTVTRREFRLRRRRRVRKKIRGTGERPRLSAFRSTKHIYAQIINDMNGRTLVSASTLDREFRDRSKSDGKVAVAKNVGRLLAQRALTKGIRKVVFDRGGFLYHGRIEALALGAREEGLEF